MTPILTLIPNQPPIELVAYYPSFSQYYPECELQTKRWFVDHVEPDWVMFDAGANIGYYSILFSRLAPQGRVFAFEPTESIEMLRANLSHNGCANVTPIPIALGSASGAREDNVYRIWGEEPERKVFDFATVDDMVERLDLRRLDCLKIDVDSFDLDVLRGAEGTLRRLDPWVVVELSDALTKRDQSTREAFEWLYSLGYRNGHVTDAENFVFRRREQPERSADVFPSLLISYDTQPLIVAPPWRIGDRLEGVFNREPIRHNAASVFPVNAEGGPLWWSVTVPGPQWSYAASWTRSERVLPPAPVVVQVEIDVSGGLVGIGCLNASETNYVGREFVLKPSPAPQIVTLVAEQGSDLGYFVVRNVDPNGMHGNVRIRSIQVYDVIARTTSPAAGLLSSAKHRISVAECAAALEGVEISKVPPAPGTPAIDIVPVAELGRALGFANAFVPEIRLYRHELADFKLEIDESAILAYLYREFQSKRHLEFGTGDGYSAAPVDSAFIDGAPAVEDVAKHTNAALQLLRPGGLLIWHGFCPDVETLARHEAVRRMVGAVVAHDSAWRAQLTAWFWIRPSWLLVGIKA